MSEALYLIAYVAGQAVAINADQVESVVDLAEVTPVPMAGPALRGLAALRSRVVTVVSLRAALGLPGGFDSNRAVIVPHDGHHYALLVDALEDIVPLTMSPLSAAIPLAPAWAAAAIGVVERAGEPILAIDPVTLIPAVAQAA